MYNKTYDDQSIRVENADFVQFMLPHLNKTDKVVDLGCGTCRKLIKVAPYVQSADGLDRSVEMLQQARKTLKEQSVDNIRLFEGDNYNTPFVSGQYDVCSSALSVWSPAEVRRLLKPTGKLFIETLCADDKLEIKDAFGCDELGPRGYFRGQTREERIGYILAGLEPFFEIEECCFVDKETTLTEEGFVKLLQVTPTIRGFSLEKDEGAVKQLVVDGKVSFVERRMMLRATAKNVKF